MLSKRIFFTLWIGCIVGTVAAIPYLNYLGTLPEAFWLWVLQMALFYGLICWLSSKIVPKTDLQPFQPLHPLTSLVSGVLVGLAIILFEKTLFQQSTLSPLQPPAWTGALISLYGGINEEVFMRLFFLTLIYWLLRKCFKGRTVILWISTFLVALLFGLGHLPVAFKLTSPSSFEIFRILLLNGIAGVVFGWLYWSRGLWTAMCAHFVADLMLHVVASSL